MPTDDIDISCAMNNHDEPMLLELTEELKGEGYTEDDVAPPGSKRVVILYP